MPELPEVETVRIGLAKTFLNQKIKNVTVARRDLRINIPESFEKNITDKVIVNFLRRGKYLIFDLNCDYYLIAHLGMSGKIKTITDERNFVPEKHDHVIIKFADFNFLMVFNDPRRFGLLTTCPKSELAKHALFKKIGLEPFDPEFNCENLYQKLHKKTENIKAALLNQEIVAGIGNIYVSEILFHADISPLRPCSQVTKEEIEKIICSTKDVLAKAIAKGGTTIRDYSSPSGEIGMFALELSVYGKEGEVCCKCHKSKIKRIVQNNRSTFYCIKHQI